MRIVERLNELIGTKNWVVAQRSKRILRKYGPDVVCLSSKRYEALWKQAAADMARADRREQLKRDIQEFEDWCRRANMRAGAGDDIEDDPPFEDREAWEHRYGQ